jgi:hypothetical protein
LQREPAQQRLEASSGYVGLVQRALVQIRSDDVVVEHLDGTDEQRLDANLVVLVSGSCPRAELADELTGAGFEVHLVGDALQATDLQHAIASGRLVGQTV